MQSNFENLSVTESLKPAQTLNFDGLQGFRMPETATSAWTNAKYDASMLAFDGANGFSLFDSTKETGKAGSHGDNSMDPRGDKDQKPEKDKDDEHERGKDDAEWVKKLQGANENNAEFKDLKESLGRVKPNDLAPVIAELKNLKHDDAMKFLKDNFDRLAGADKGISMQELANEFENNKDPKQRAACLYATRYFGDFAKAANWFTQDWSGPVIDKADLDKAQKPGH